MTSEEFRTNPLLLRNQFARSGTFEIPVIHKEKVSLENMTLIGYDKINSGKENKLYTSSWMTISLKFSGIILSRGSKGFLRLRQFFLLSLASILKCQWRSRFIILSEAGGAVRICKAKESK